MIINLSEFMTEKVKNILAKVFGSKYKGKEKSESTGTKLTESTGPVYYRTRIWYKFSRRKYL